MSDKVSEEGRKSRFAQWDKLGLDRVKQDLLNGGFELVGGPPQVRELAWEWVRAKEAELKENKDEIVMLKPSLWGVGINLKEILRRLRKK